MLLQLLFGLLLLAQSSGNAETLARAEELLDANQAAPATLLLDSVLDREPKNVRALLLRSTARFLQGQIAEGEADLRRCLELDPKQRQAWLNLGALELSNRDYEEALAAFEKARDLDPSAPDNAINLGAVLLLLDRLEEASEKFEEHIANEGGSGDAYYLVATNYAMAGYSALALRHLAGALQADEKTRLQVRADPNFTDLAKTEGFQQLMETDTFVPAPGSYITRHAFDVPYAATDSRLLNATLDALGTLQIPYDRRVEVTPGWALIWADMRIKISRDPATGRGLVEATAVPAAFNPTTWRERNDALRAAIEQALATYGRRER
ncbi:MAG: tetratricopeptide repeat protein [Thermoanaerobaculia bacterium]|nr:tetratricopeptide repeat protein [Thermoanaerobaculia bacterium]